MRLWPSKLAIPAAVSSTNAPNATSIITTSTTARWIFMVSRSLPAMELGPVLRLGTVTSTQDVAHDLGIGSVVLADYQTGGRGRLERPWMSPVGTALLVSFVLQPNPTLSLAAGVAAAEACGPGVRLKWPNDLLLEGRKVGGILVEVAGARAIVGIGINLSWAPEGGATLGEDRDQLLERLLDKLQRWSVAEGPEILAAWRLHSDTLGRRVRVQLAGESIEGLAEDLADDGSLVVAGKLVSAGDVIYLRAREDVAEPRRRDPG